MKSERIIITSKIKKGRKLRKVNIGEEIPRTIFKEEKEFRGKQDRVESELTASKIFQVFEFNSKRLRAFVLKSDIT